MVVGSSGVCSLQGGTYGAGGGTLKGLLALDGDVGAIGRLELDVKGGCEIGSAFHPSYRIHLEEAS
jgi:hypothetical protein